ncbi:MAG: hypothetical protein HY696_11730 [Deltaproteobacteria bacterium]|nr:hypothetical protein [Deltaproteobacteria bacterium]
MRTISASPTPAVLFDRGAKKKPRAFESVDRCVETPCIVTQHGAWQFAPSVVDAYRVEMSYFHEGSQRPIGLFQQSTTLEQKVAERLLNRHPNRKIVNLMQLVERGTAPTIFMYGVLLQYEIRDGDPVIVRLTRFADPTDVREYYFRYHKTGPVPDIDISLLYPIGFFHPNPNDAIQGATTGAAFSFSIGSHMDPERHYGWFRKSLRAVRLNLFTGLVTRKELKAMGGDLVVSDSVDGFGGIGLTVFDFLNLGYGINFVRTPHSTFPFVGIEVKHVFEFIRSLKQDTHTKWEKYLREEREQRGSPQTGLQLGRTSRSK